MTTTYTLAATGRAADSTFSVANIKIPDNYGLTGAAAGAMQSNTQLLCKRPDGTQAYYTIDAERTTPGNIVLKAVGP